MHSPLPGLRIGGVVFRSGTKAWPFRSVGRGLIATLVTTAAGVARDAQNLAPLQTSDFSFVSSGLTLSGVISQPAQGETKALIVFVHGYGPTDVRGWNMYADLRARFAELGIASATWDKPGQGRSEGSFDVNQPVASSAQEVVDAVADLRTRQVAGAHRIGIWGISRAGWIAPLVIQRDPHIRFWISVSGVTAEDNFLYLLQSNLPHEGSTVAEAEALIQEWKRSFELFRTGASYDEYHAATRNLRANGYLARMLGSGYTRDVYAREQAKLGGAEGARFVDVATGMTIYVANFDALLANLDIDVLALFGEKDLNVDWRKTRALYEATLGRNARASLTTRTFPDANHNLDVAETGSMREMQSKTRRRKSDGYYETQLDWLRRRVLAEGAH
ncbi:MAG TPA: alpha/beta hydrolase [Candidatus Synoicihabitans sp.]|nr:alpha/beta hydrolase [Candidatus Synoicihabitans sp.]